MSVSLLSVVPLPGKFVPRPVPPFVIPVGVKSSNWQTPEEEEEWLRLLETWKPPWVATTEVYFHPFGWPRLCHLNRTELNLDFQKPKEKVFIQFEKRTWGQAQTATTLAEHLQHKRREKEEALDAELDAWLAQVPVPDPQR